MGVRVNNTELPLGVCDLIKVQEDTMNTLKITLALIMLSATVFANEASDKCDQQNGSWEWNGNANQWQCIGGDEIVALAPIAAETNTTELNTTELNVTELNVTKAVGEGFTAKKALAYAALPVVIAGVVVAAVVLTPVWIIKSIFK